MRLPPPPQRLIDLAIEIAQAEKRLADLQTQEDRDRARAAYRLPAFSLKAFAGDHADQYAFITDRSHRIHGMCARQTGKSQGDGAIMLDSGLTRPQSTNLFLGLNRPAVRTNVWEPIWCRLWDRFDGLDPEWLYDGAMVTRFPNGARCLFGGTDDMRHIKNLLGGRIEDGVVIVDECQDQVVLDELLDSTLPPMMGKNARLILTGVFPEVPAGRFWRESGWVEREDGWHQEPKGGWSHHNWGRLANVHTPDAREVLDRYLADTGLSEEDPQIQRDWFGRPAFDPLATTYHYRRERNSYTPIAPDWAEMAWASGKCDRGHALAFCHPMRTDKDGGRYGMMAAEPMPGVCMFALALDPGSNSDRASIQGWGWGKQSRIMQHVFDWTSQRKARLTTGQMFAVLGLAYRMLAKAGGRLGGVVQCRYDAGSSQNTIDNLQRDYAIPLVRAAKKSDLKGQIDRNNTMLEEARAMVMQGSALEQDYSRARWDKSSREHGQYKWAAAWHPDASEAARYAMQDYFDAYQEPEPVPTDPMEVHRAEVREMLREARARDEADEAM